MMSRQKEPVPLLLVLLVLLVLLRVLLPQQYAVFDLHLLNREGRLPHRTQDLYMPVSYFPL
jgi:hypothetical protein